MSQIVPFVTGAGKEFLARLIQHEIDHLHGVLFMDIAKKLYPLLNIVRCVIRRLHGVIVRKKIYVYIHT